MRNVSDALQARLDSGATTMCRCWLVVRRDGIRFGFTDHDRDLSLDGDVFRAGSGLDASVLEASTGLSVDNAQAVQEPPSHGSAASLRQREGWTGSDRPARWRRPRRCRQRLR